MKKLSFWFFSLGTIIVCTLSAQTTTTPTTTSTNNQSARIGIVNTKKCLEKSKLGKQEQSNFEKMKTQMETVLQEKEKKLEEIEIKLNDDDYMDSVSEETAMELKRDRRTIREEGARLQNQYMQTLQQANVKIIQKLTDSISKASEQVAQDTTKGPFDVILTDEACTFFVPRLDVSDLIISKMDTLFDAENKDAPKP